MAARGKATPGNKLYIYKLLRAKLGVGKQEFLPNVEKILQDDDVYPEDLGYDSALDMFRAFDEFVNLTEFKGGRSYVRLIQRPDWDKWLGASSAEKSEHKSKPAHGKARPWKHNKKAPKVVRPVKPKHKIRVEQVELQLEDAAAPAQPTAAATPASAEPTTAAPLAGAPQQEDSSSQAPQAGPAPATTAAQPTESGDKGNNPKEQSAVPETTQTRDASAQGQNEPDAEPKQPAAQEAASDAAAVPHAREATPAKPRTAPEPPKIRLRIVSEGPSEQAAEGQAAEPATASEPADTPANSGQVAHEKGAAEVSGAPRAASEEAGTAQSLEAPLSPTMHMRPGNLPVSFWNEVHCKDELLSILTRTLPFDVDLTRVLEEDWQVARSTGLATGSRSKVTFPIRYLRPDGTRIELTIRRISKPVGGKHWTLALVDGDDGTGTLHEAAGLEGAPQGDEGAWQDLSAMLLPADLRVSPLRELAQFCSIGSWETTLGALTSMAAPERWDFPGEGVGRTSRFGILREYLCVTLHRLREQNKVAVSPAKDFCVVNTGLMTPMTEDIYACFTPTKGDAAPWSFAGFAVAGSGELGRKITATFDPLPQPASYIQDLDQVMPRPNKLIALDYRSIIGRQLDRLPRGFLQEQFEHHATAAPLLAKATAGDASLAERNQALRDLGRVALSDPGLYRRLCLALDDAVAMAKHRVRASFRLCAPAYDPQTGLVDLLLPLALIADGQADCALVLEPQPSGNYQASSVLTLPRAYACARVISKYQPAWLLPEHVLAK